MRRCLIISVTWAVGILLSVSAPAWAQRTTATFAGIVTDKSGGVLPGADVELANKGTGIVERQVTGATGEFIFNYVPGGTYTLTISIPGFKSYTATGIELGAAQNVRRTFELEVGEIAENVTVSGEAPLVNTVSAEQRVSLEPLEVQTLPVLDRNIAKLLDVGSGLTKQEGRAVRLRLNGLGGSGMSVTADGTDANGNSGSRQLSQYDNVSKIDVVSIEAVGEVQIVKGVVPAEYGQALAGNLNIITKPGSNTWNGSLFHRYEGSALSARPPLLTSKSDSTWNQYGGSLGGPIMRDHAFFFAAFEGYRQNAVVPLNANVPTQRFRDLALAALPFPETRLLLDRYPMPTEPVAPDALAGVFIGPGPKENSDEHVDVRTDFRIRGGNLSVSFTGGHPFLIQASSGLPSEARTWKTLNRRATASYAVARGHWSSQTRFGYRYNWLSRTEPYINVTDPNKEATIPGLRGIASLNFPGITGIKGEQHTRGQIPSYSFEQQFAISTDRHAFKFGGLYSLLQGGRYNIENPSVSYVSLADLLANRPSSVAVTFGTTDSTWKTTNYGFFAQDDWRLSSQLVLNLGVRYDFFGRFKVQPADPQNPAGIFNLDGLLDSEFHFGPPRDPDKPYEDDKGINVAPRISFAYNPDKQGRTVVTGGWGMMFQPADIQNFEPSIAESLKIPRGRTFSAQEAAALGLGWPIYNEDQLLAVRQEVARSGGPDYLGILIDPHLQAPHAMVYTLSVQRAIGSSMVVEGGYVHTRGYDFLMSRTYNEPDRLTGLRPNPILSQGAYHDNSQRTTYHALQTSLRQRRWKNTTFNLNYTLSKNMATAGGDGTPSFIGDSIASVQDFFDLDSAWGPAAGDVTHLFVGSAIYQLPAERWTSSLSRQLLGDWQFAGIFRAQSGLPLLITQTSARGNSRPDVLDAENAVNTACCGPGNLQYLNRAAFQLVPVNAVSRQTIRAGDVANGQFRAPGFRSLDFSVTKSIPVGNGKRIELRADMSNALNWTNYTTIQTNVTAANFGQVTGLGDARIVQLQARFTF